MKKICTNCNLEFEQNSGKQKFCSDKCKVAYARASKKPITTDKEEIIGLSEFHEEMIKKCDEHDKLSLKIQSLKLTEKWIGIIEDFCSNERIFPLDLIECYKNRNKAVKGLKIENKVKIHDLNMDKSVGTVYNPNNNPIWKKKMGL